jgi:hypothetical protein
MDPDPAIFVIDLTKTIFLSNFFCFLLFEGTVHLYFFPGYKVIKKSQNSRNQGYSYNFCLMIEESVSGAALLSVSD